MNFFFFFGLAIQMWFTIEDCKDLDMTGFDNEMGIVDLVVLVGFIC